MLRRFLPAFIYATVFATGAAGLVYQVAWQKYLSRLLGSDSLATAVILAAFLGGLSIGYYVCGNYSTRIRNHFKAYALLEGCIGIWCLGFPVLFGAIDTVTRSWSFASPLLILGQGLFCSVLLMGLPTVCMGGTIPFLTRGISKSVAEATRVHATVYAVNTAGAFLGTLCAGFFLIPALGMPLTMMSTALVNLAACLFFYAVSGVLPADEPTEANRATGPAVGAGPAPPEQRAFSPAVLAAIAFLSGFYVMTLENVLIRITNLCLGSSSYSFTMIVAVFIFSIAAGSYAVGRCKQLPKQLLFFNQLAIALLLLILYSSLDTWPYWAHIVRIMFSTSTPGFWGYYLFLLIALTGILLLPAGLMGATVPIAFHELKRDLKHVGSHSGLLFSWNTLGSLAGSLAGGIALYVFVDMDGVFLSAVMLAAASACLAGWQLSRRYLFPVGCFAAVACAITAFCPVYSKGNFMLGTFLVRTPLPFSLDGPDDFFRRFTAPSSLKFYKDGPACTVSVVESRKPHPAFNRKARSIIINGKSDSSTIGDIYTLKLCAHLPALLARRREQVMVIGLGTGVTAGELTLYPDVNRIDVAEIAPAVIEALPLFDSDTHGVHRDRRVHIHTGDAFRILGRSARRWDIIISEPSNPWVTGVDLLFTREFYRLALKHLTDDGVLLQWTHVYFANTRMLGMILNTVQQEFAYVRVFMPSSGDLLIMASGRPLSDEDVRSAEKLFQSNSRVRDSLSEIDITSVACLLVREIWGPSYIADTFSGCGLQTMDNPRLHYLAGRSFFSGEHVPSEYFLTSAAVPYSRELLLVQRYPAWVDFPFAGSDPDAFLRSVNNKVSGKPLPMAASLKLRSYLGSPDAHPLSQRDRERFMVDLLPFVTGRSEGMKSGRPAGIPAGTYREKVGMLLDHATRFRTWLVPYPLDGIRALLREGMVRGADACEKNWCVLQLAMLLAQEHADVGRIAAVLENLIRGRDGVPLIEQQDAELLNRLLREVGKSKRPPVT